MQGIVNKDKEVLEVVLKAIDNVMRFIFSEGTETYSYIRKHPKKELYALVIDVNDVVMMLKEHPEKIEEIGSGLIEQIVDLPIDEWIIKEEDLI